MLTFCERQKRQRSSLRERKIYENVFTNKIICGKIREAKQNLRKIYENVFTSEIICGKIKKPNKI